ncbi:unnamed protein product [Meloidogyne enterolobii]|uniref:Uncharacterized protein n=1 Tax=Meloidogyne enterolobii TaxID=390850 RepID=A0ACB0Y349_MELEN
MQNYSNISDNLSFALNVDDNFKGSNKFIAYDILLFLLIYSLLIPLIILCWVLILRFLRNRGLITSTQENAIASNIKDIPLVGLPRSITHYNLPIGSECPVN